MGVQLEPAPVCKFSPDGSQIMLGDYTKPYVASSQPAGPTDKVFERSVRQTGQWTAGDSQPAATDNASLNTVLIYNCAAMSYQT